MSFENSYTSPQPGLNASVRQQLVSNEVTSSSAAGNSNATNTRKKRNRDPLSTNWYDRRYEKPSQKQNCYGKGPTSKSHAARLALHNRRSEINRDKIENYWNNYLDLQRSIHFPENV